MDDVKSTLRVARLGQPLAETVDGCGEHDCCIEASRPKFEKCEECAAKPGSPVLCDDCLRRRDRR